MAEIAALWHLPGRKINLPNILWGRTLITQTPADLPVAENLSEEGKKTVCFFAKTEFKNKVANFGLKKADRRLHFYTTGKTGTGKSTLIANMAISDIGTGEGWWKSLPRRLTTMKSWLAWLTGRGRKLKNLRPGSNFFQKSQPLFRAVFFKTFSGRSQFDN
ncbi:hypothetical protein KBI33_01730 [Candidatus Shapirobacteria bacterium]|nr:hypothetical protein [Candidatus Shapirobacteria bacterium]